MTGERPLGAPDGLPREEFRGWLEDDGLRICCDRGGRPHHATYFWPYPSGPVLEWATHEEGAWVPPVDVMAPEYW